MRQGDAFWTIHEFISRSTDQLKAYLQIANPNEVKDDPAQENILELLLEVCESAQEFLYEPGEGDMRSYPTPLESPYSNLTASLSRTSDSGVRIHPPPSLITNHKRRRSPPVDMLVPDLPVVDPRANLLSSGPSSSYSNTELLSRELAAVQTAPFPPPPPYDDRDVVIDTGSGALYPEVPQVSDEHPLSDYTPATWTRVNDEIEQGDRANRNV